MNNNAIHADISDKFYVGLLSTLLALLGTFLIDGILQLASFKINHYDLKFPHTISKSIFYVSIIAFPILMLFIAGAIYQSNRILRTVKKLGFSSFLFIAFYLCLFLDLKHISATTSFYTQFSNPAHTIFAFLILALLPFRKLRFIFIALICYWVVLNGLLYVFHEGNSGGLSDFPSFPDVLHPLIEVFHGGSILHDFGSQYGLYPVFLEPLFSLTKTKLTVWNFTICMGVISSISLACLFIPAYRMSRNKFPMILGMLAMLWWTTGMAIDPHALETGIANPYFQYFPIRIFFQLVAY